jgi:hypothetical protein
MKGSFTEYDFVYTPKRRTSEQSFCYFFGYGKEEIYYQKEGELPVVLNRSRIEKIVTTKELLDAKLLLYYTEDGREQLLTFSYVPSTYYLYDPFLNWLLGLEKAFDPIIAERNNPRPMELFEESLASAGLHMGYAADYVGLHHQYAFHHTCHAVLVHVLVVVKRYALGKKFATEIVDALFQFTSFHSCDSGVGLYVFVLFAMHFSVAKVHIYLYIYKQQTSFCGKIVLFLPTFAGRGTRILKIFVPLTSKYCVTTLNKFLDKWKKVHCRLQEQLTSLSCPRPFRVL